MKLNKFVPLTKMEEQTDGTLYVFGTVTAQLPDLENEVCDYAGTKPLYEKRCAERLEMTSRVEGMTPSIMAMRDMHQLKAIGAGRDLFFDDEKKTIKMGFHVVDPTAVAMWKAGGYVGFSQGGAYVEKWADPDFKGCIRYIADPQEVSAVDAPCLPSALVESMKGRTVQLQKSTGTTEEVKLMSAPTAVVSLQQQLEASKKATEHALKLGDRTKEERAAIVAAAKTHGIAMDECAMKALDRALAKAAVKHGVQKGLYEVGWLGDMLEQLHWLCLQTEWERDVEDDGSKVPDGLREAWMSLIAEFKAMAVEEADELAAQGGKGDAVKITDQAGLTKAAKTIHDHLAKLKEKHEAAGEHMKKAHEAMQKKHEEVGEHIEKCMKAAKEAADGNEPDEAEKVTPAGESEAIKALTEQVAAMAKSQAELTEKLAKTAAPGGAASGAANDVNKAAPTGAAADVPAGLEGIVNTPPAAK